MLRSMISHSKEWAKARGDMFYKSKDEVHGAETWKIPTSSTFELLSLLLSLGNLHFLIVFKIFLEAFFMRRTAIRKAFRYNDSVD